MKLSAATGQITPVAPFDFDKSLGFIRDFKPTQQEQTLSDRTLTKAVLVEGQIVVFRLRSIGTIDQPRLEYTLYSRQSLDAGIQQAALDRVGFSLSLMDDLKPFYTISQGDPGFAPVVDQLYGLHQVKFITPFENACWAVITQRTPISAAQQVKQALVEKFGDCLMIDDIPYWAFPDPDRLAAASERELSKLLKNARKAEYLNAVIHAFQHVDEGFLRTGDYDQVRAWLLNIKGIGEWSADFILLRSLGRMQQLHIASKSIFEQRMIDAAYKVYGNGRPMTAKAVLAIAERYGQWQGYWAYYLRTAA